MKDLEKKTNTYQNAVKQPKKKIEIEVNSVNRVSRVTAHAFTLTVNGKEVEMYVEIITAKLKPTIVSAIIPSLISSAGWRSLSTDEQTAVNEEINKYFKE